ncbi:MAG: uracil-DNA glycosylase [bacterium]|nr:uracil-DNA glycosylase [bacterium]
MLGVRDIPIRLPERAVPGSPRLPQKSAEEVADRDERLGALDAEHVKSCAKCSLSETRTKTVFGQGSSAAALMFVGEAPGFDEDRQGLAFVGKAGQLLSKMIVAMGLKREDVYICNVLKCRPPNNRDPAADEIAACCPYLYEQIGIIEPSIIVALGAPAARTLLQSKQGIGRLRGRLHDFFASGIEGVGPAIPLMPTYHPAYLLRSPGEKGKAWSDLQAVMERLGLPMPKK